mgnify:CR=1 FL=1
MISWTFLQKIFNLTTFKIVILLIIQVVFGYYTLLLANFTALNYVKYFPIIFYFITLFGICYVIYCYRAIYIILTNKIPNHIRLVNIGLIIFYISSLISYTFVGGSYSPFFLIGIKLAQSKLG